MRSGAAAAEQQQHSHSHSSSLASTTASHRSAPQPTAAASTASTAAAAVDPAAMLGGRFAAPALQHAFATMQQAASYGGVRRGGGVVAAAAGRPQLQQQQSHPQTHADGPRSYHRNAASASSHQPPHQQQQWQQQQSHQQQRQQQPRAFSGGGRGDSGQRQPHQHQKQQRPYSSYSSNRSHSSQDNRGHRGQQGRSAHSAAASGAPVRTYPRRWVDSVGVDPAPAAAAPARPPLDYKLVCYNVLCGEHIQPNYFPRTPAAWLRDDFRRQTIVKQLTTQLDHPLCGADLIALQEVDSFDSFWSPHMSAAGYECMFHTRPSGSMRRTRGEGSAIMWRRSAFDKVDELRINYTDYPTAERKDNVGLGVMLRCKEQAEASAAAAASSSPNAPRYLALVNTHLLWNPKRGDLKIGQMQLLMNGVDAWLNRFCRQQLEARPNAPVPHIALMLCGDMNALPNSTLVQFALEGELDLAGEAAFAAMPEALRAAHLLNRFEIDGYNSHLHAKSFAEQVERDERATKATSESAASASAAASKSQRRAAEEEQQSSSKKQRRESNGDAMSDETTAPTMANLAAAYEEKRAENDGDSSSSSSSDGDDRYALPAASASASSAASSPSFPYRPTCFLEPFPKHTLQASNCLNFFPFSPWDQPTHIRHALKLKSALVDPSTIRLRHTLDALKRNSGAAASTAVPLVDPHSGLPVRYRPTSHHHRFSGQVDHIFFSPLAYRFDSSQWRADVCGDRPMAVMQHRLNEHEQKQRRQTIDLTSDDAAASSAEPSPPPAIRMLSLLEFPPVSAFQPFVRVEQTQAAAVITSSMSDAAGASVQQQVTSTQQQRTVRVVDAGLPVPESPSDHFPLAVRFRVL